MKKEPGHTKNQEHRDENFISSKFCDSFLRLDPLLLTLERKIISPVGEDI